MRDSARSTLAILIIVVTAMSAGGLAFSAVASAPARSGSSTPWMGWSAFQTLFLIGGGLGLLSSPFAMAVLTRRSLPLGLLATYGTMVLVAVLSVYFGFGCFAIPLSVVTFGMSCAAVTVMVSWNRLPPDVCQNCQYDLRGSVGPVCPECGTPKARTQQ